MLKLAERARELYNMCPSSGGNGITERLTRLLGAGSASIVNSARRQQGLIYLAKTYCLKLRCRECPVAAELIPASPQHVV